jgi:hypothetical protein
MRCMALSAATAEQGWMSYDERDLLRGCDKGGGGGSERHVITPVTETIFRALCLSQGAWQSINE